jgi:hypothetical protein
MLDMADCPVDGKSVRWFIRDALLTHGRMSFEIADEFLGSCDFAMEARAISQRNRPNATIVSLPTPNKF